ncbi:response regulator transcription factor [Cellulomonas soli]
MPADVLVVDDDPGLRELLDSGLAFAGYRVRTAATAAEAFDRLREERPDAVVLDVVLPGTDGLDVLRLLRSTGDRTPVLLLTARDAVPDRVAGLTAGADDYLTKPFDLTELVARLEALLRRTAAPTADPGSAAGGDEQSAVRRPRAGPGADALPTRDPRARPVTHRAAAAVRAAAGR